MGCVTVMKVKLDTGRYHQDFGYSESIARTEGLAIFKARAVSYIFGIISLHSLTIQIKFAN